MSIKSALAAAAAVFLLAAPAQAQSKLELKFTTASTATDIHTRAMKVFAETLEKLAPGRFDTKLFDSGTLFGQGADLDALQRGNAEATYVSFQLIADNIPEFGLFAAGYLFQNPEHYRKVMASDIGKAFKKRVDEEMGIQLLDVCYLGTRQLNLRKAREVATPKDLAGVKLRMPSSENWLFLGSALGASPTPLPFGEVYLALQTGTIDAQDNPLPTVESAKFFEVTEQIVLTSHLVDGINIAVGNKFWAKLNAADKEALSKAATAACDWNNERRISDEARLVDFFKSKNLKVTTPDVAAFRDHVQKAYATSPKAAKWPKDWVSQINALAK